MRSRLSRWTSCALALWILAASAPLLAEDAPPDIQAINAFLYYDDVDAAWDFYNDVLGFETVVDYGFARILRIAESSYLTVVDAAAGMHSTEEPRTVLLTLVTDNTDAWRAHAMGQSIAILEADAQADEFVISDPQGYLIRFTPLPSGELPGATRPISVTGNRSIHASVYSIYVEDFRRSRAFYEELFPTSPAASSVAGARLHISPGGYLELVDGSDEWHRATVENGVTISFFTDDVDKWFEHASTRSGFELRTPQILNESELVRVFVGYDPEGYFLEWDTFVDRRENSALLNYLGK